MWSPCCGNNLVGGLAGSNPSLAALINLIDIAFYGIGMVLFIIMAVFVTNRLILHKMPPAMAAPTFWVLLGPVGVGTIALLGLAGASETLGLTSATDVFGMLSLTFWGFGLWAFALTAVVTIKYLKSGGVPFSLSWWAFIFPLAAYTMASLEIYNYTRVPLVFWYAAALAALLTVLWAATFIKTLTGTLNGRLLSPPSAPAPARKPAK
ncbi:MAG: hypothetical protein ACOY31_07390 [Bacillota bacterium]